MFLSEIFSSWQGEGPWAGVKQVFVRLAGCSLGCSYCDTPEARRPSSSSRIERVPLSREFEPVANPLTPEEVAAVVGGLWDPSYHSVSLTGGEPLEQVEDLRALMLLLRGASIPTYLESNGTLPAALGRVVDLADFISMDIKLDTAGGTGDLLESHVEFLRIAAARPVFLKAVITCRTDPAEAERAFAALADIKRDAPLVLQPVSLAGGEETPDFELLARFQELASGYFDEVRIIPQMHKYWKIA